jgi:hypothetical protein
VAIDETGAKFAQYGVIEARITELQPKHVLPIDATADSIRRLAIRQAFCKLEQGDERQAPRSFGRLPAWGNSAVNASSW